MTTGSRLRRLREDKGVTLEDVATACGVSYQYINQLETDKKPVSGKMIRLLSDYYGVSSDYILGKQLDDYKDKYKILYDIANDFEKPLKDILLEIFTTSPNSSSAMEMDAKEGCLTKEDMLHILEQIRYLKAKNKKD